MALPTLESTWTHVNNTQLVYTTEANMTSQIFWRMTRALVACPGATVRFSNSNTGTSATVDGVDNLTTFASVQARTATETTANTSFIVVRLSGVGSTFDVCIAHCSSSASSISISMSVGGNFVPAATPTHHPTATDRMYAGSGTTFGLVALTNTATNRRFHYSYTAAGDQIRFMVTVETTLVFQTLTEIGLCDGQYTASWIGPQAHITHANTTGWGMTNSNIKTRVGITLSFTPVAQYWGYMYGIIQVTSATTENANELPIGTIHVSLASGTGQFALLCRLKDIFCTSTAVVDGTYFPNPGTKTFIVMSDVVLPWDGSTLL